MSHTIQVKVFGPAEAMECYFRERGMTFSNGFDDGTIFLIELREPPAILVRLEAAGYFLERGEENSSAKRAWNMMDANEHGILIYICSTHTEDGYIFIPHHNVIAIRTADNDYFSSLSRALQRASTS